MLVNQISKYVMHWEGFRSKPYRCPSGRLTIGYGRNIQDNPLTTEELRILFPDVVGINEANQKLYRDGITSKQALILLNRELLQQKREYLDLLEWFRNLSDLRQLVIRDMCYNLGYSGLMKFKKMIKAIKKGDYNEAAEQIRNSRYYRQVGLRAETNCRIMRFGTMPDNISI